MQSASSTSSAPQPKRRAETRASASQPQPADNTQSLLNASPATLFIGLVSGVCFGFLLQKGGVAKFDILIGVLLLENFVVIKIMLSAILVGMVGSYLLRRMGQTELKIDETIYGRNIFGALLFGAGFALLAYCPGTNAAAVGQGNLDALTGVLGLIVGSYAFAYISKFKSVTSLFEWGNRGKLTLPSALNISAEVFVPTATLLFLGILYAFELAGY